MPVTAVIPSQIISVDPYSVLANPNGLIGVAESVTFARMMNAWIAGLPTADTGIPDLPYKAVGTDGKIHIFLSGSPGLTGPFTWDNVDITWDSISTTFDQVSF